MQNWVFSRRIESLECALGLNMNFMFCKWTNKDWKEVADEIWSLFFFFLSLPSFLVHFMELWRHQKFSLWWNGE